MSGIELLLRSRLVKESLSAILTEAGFLISCRPDLDNDNIIVVIDFEDYKDREAIRAHQSRGVKIVVLADGADNLGMSADEIAPLSGVLTHELSAKAFVQSLRLICSGERVFPRDVALGRHSAAQSPGTKLHPDGAECIMTMKMPA